MVETFRSEAILAIPRYPFLPDDLRRRALRASPSPRRCSRSAPRRVVGFMKLADHPLVGTM
jgi:hypothetical protein